MNALTAVAQRVVRPMVPSRSASDFTFGDWLSLFTIDSPFFIGSSALRPDVEEPAQGMLGITSIYARNSVAFASLAARAKLFSQVRFQFQQMFGGREGSLFGTPDLRVLERPEPGETTIDLMYRGILDADLAGDWFGVRRQIGGTDRMKRIRPDWTTIVLGSRNPNADPDELAMDPDAEIIGYGYQPGGPGSGAKIIAFGAEEVAHFHPNPNPLSLYRGMPLILAALPEIMSDTAAVQHKRAFFNNAATPNLAMSFPPTMDETKAREWIQIFEGKHRGALNAYKALYMGGGMTFQAVGSNFQQMTFKELQGSAETRIAAMTGIHPTVIGLSEGLQGSSLNAGNFTAAARMTADVTLRFLWGNMCGSLEVVVPPPSGTRLWHDEGSVPFLQADVLDHANVTLLNQQAITGYVKEGFTPVSAIDAVVSGDPARLKHSGLISVQLQPPGAEQVARHDFWPSSGPLAAIGVVHGGTTFGPDHPLIQAFPSMFEPVADLAQLEPGLIVTRDVVIAKRTELLAGGKDAGYESLARELGVSRNTIRRRLS